MLAPWEIAEAEAIRATRRLIEVAPSTTEDLAALLAEHDDQETTPERQVIVRRELHKQLADALRHFKAHRRQLRQRRGR